eukprot:455847_1
MNGTEKHNIDTNIFTNVQSHNDLCVGKYAVKDCPHLLRIIHGLKYYHTLLETSTTNNTNTQFIDFCQQNYSTQCLDDYIHVISTHAETESLTKIRNYIHNDHNINICTNIHECKSIQRHYRNRNDATKSNPDKYSFYLEIFEAIHCYIFHLETLGFRISSDIEYKQSKYDDELNCDDFELRNLKQAIENRMKESNKLKNMCKMNDLKFKIMVAKPPDADNIEYKIENKAMDEKDNHDVIEFKWNKDMTTKTKCDTQHMLYLLSLAIEFVNERTIKRNKYFTSIQRFDRVYPKLNVAKIITNILDWCNKNEEVNKFNGEILDKADPTFVIKQILNSIAQIPLAPAIKVYNTLKKDVVIETTTWFELPQPKLKLETYGYTKMYKRKKILKECSVEEMIKLLTYVNPEEKGDDEYAQGVFAAVIEINKKKGKQSALEKEQDWQNKVIQFFLDNQLDGKTFMEKSVKQTCLEIMNAVIPPTVLNEKGKPQNFRLRSGVNQILRGLKRCYVDGILSESMQ